MIISILASIGTSGQDEVLAPEFRDLEPVWTYVVEDANVSVDSFRARYLDIFYTLMEAKNEKVYLYALSYVNGDEGPDISGGIVLKLDQHTGEEECRNSFNQYSEDSIQSYYRYFRLAEDQLRVYGAVKVKDSGDAPWWAYANSSTYRHSIKVIDAENCHLIDHFGDRTDTVGLTGHPVHVALYDSAIDTVFFRLLSKVYRDAYTEFFIMDTSLSIDTGRYARVDYVPPVEPDLFDISNLPFWVNEHLTISYFHQDDLTSVSPVNADLYFINTSDPNNIFIDTIVNVTDLVFDEAPLTTRRVMMQDSIILLNGVYDSGLGVYKAWLLWIDTSGSIISSMDEMSINGHQYLDFRSIEIAEDSCILLGSPSSSGYPGWDVLRLYANGLVEKVGEFTTDGDVDYTNFLSITRDGNYIFTVAKPNKKNTTVFAFDATDLGLISSTVSATRPIGGADHPTRLKVYPNPVNATLHVHLPEEKTYRYFIVDMSGRSIKQGEVSSRGGVGSIDASLIERGLYSVSIIDGSTCQSSRVFKY